MSCESKFSTEALNFEQQKDLRNLNNLQELLDIRMAKEEQQKMQAIDFDAKKASRNLVFATTHRENYDASFKRKRVILAIDFDQSKAFRDLA